MTTLWTTLAMAAIPAEAVGAIITAVVIGLGTYGYKQLRPQEPSNPEHRYVTHKQYDADLKRVYDLIYKNSETTNQLIGAISTQVSQNKPHT